MKSLTISKDRYILTRHDNQEKLELPPDLQWADEHQWNAVAQATPQRTLSGGLIIQQGVKRGGRPITLQGDWVWLYLSTIRILRDWTDVPDLVMTLAHPDGRIFNVIFRTHDTALSNIAPVQFSMPEADDEKYNATICLMTIEI